MKAHRVIFVAFLLGSLGTACSDNGGGDDCSGDGVWYDDASALCWQDPPSDDEMSWSDAVSYCNGLVLGGLTDWRLPDVDELIGLLRGCQDGTSTGDLSPSTCETAPDGCAATDDCSGATGCGSCGYLSGPGEGGCYWDPALTGGCDWYSSSSSYANDVSYAWTVTFGYGDANYGGAKSDARSVRCVRSGP